MLIIFWAVVIVVAVVTVDEFCSEGRGRRRLSSFLEPLQEMLQTIRQRIGGSSRNTAGGDGGPPGVELARLTG